MRMRLPAARTPTQLAAAVRREAVVRAGALRTGRALREAGRDGTQVLVGPFLGEIGYELLYWIPFLRRALSSAGVRPDQTTVVTRGGAGLWYSDLAAHELDVLDLVPPETFLPRLEERRRQAGDAKQLLIERFDLELIQRARERLGAVTVIHPSLMFARLRGLWFTGMPLAEAETQLEYRLLDVPAPPPPPGVSDRYVAVKAYFNDCLPDADASRTFLHRLVERLAVDVDVVLLSTGLALDDHLEWTASGPRIHRVDQLVTPRDNLAVQTRVIAGARGLVATYGGFSYLGPLLDVPTLACYEREATVPLHLEALRAAVPDADYLRVGIGELDAVGAFARRMAA